MNLHPLCALFPEMSGDEFASLVADIKANGLRDPIVTLDGQILDGQNRQRACDAAGVKPIYVSYTGADPATYIEGKNLHRRHLTAGQRASAVAALQDWRQAATRGGDRKSDQSAILHFDRAEERAAKSGASVRTQKMADTVQKADPELSRAVVHGDVTLPEAVEKVTGKRPGKKKSKTDPPRTAELHRKKSNAIPIAPPIDTSDDGDGPSAAELEEARRAAEDDAERVRVLLESDEPLRAMTEKCAQLQALVRTLTSRINGLMNETAEATRLAKMWRKKFEKLEKEAAGA